MKRKKFPDRKYARFFKAWYVYSVLKFASCLSGNAVRCLFLLSITRNSQTQKNMWSDFRVLILNHFVHLSQSVQRLSYGLDGQGIESLLGGEIFRTRPDLSWGSPSLLYNGYRDFPGDKAAGACRWPPTPIYRRGWRKSRVIHLLPLWAFVGCSRESFTFTFTFFVRLYRHNCALSSWQSSVWIYLWVYKCEKPKVFIYIFQNFTLIKW